MATSHALALWEQGDYLHDILGYGQYEYQTIVETMVDIACEDAEDARPFVNAVVPHEKVHYLIEVIELLETNILTRKAATRADALDLVRTILKDRNLRAVKEGRKIALGFLQPRHVEDLPKPVPLDVWEGNVDWKESSVFGGGLYFHSVRLVDTPDIKPTSRKRVGRPSREATILKAFRWGLDNDTIDLSHSKTTIYKKVTEIIRFQFPSEFEDGKGLGDTPMKKYLSKRIDEGRTR